MFRSFLTRLYEPEELNFPAVYTTGDRTVVNGRKKQL